MDTETTRPADDRDDNDLIVAQDADADEATDDDADESASSSGDTARI